MIVIGIDPGIRSTGFVALDMAEGDVLDACLIKPKPQRGHWTDRLLSVRQQIGSRREWANAWVMEDLGIHIDRKRHGGHGAGMSMYGAAGAAIWFSLDEGSRHILPADAFNAGPWRTKQHRRRRVLAEFPALEDVKDIGHDVSDAAAVAIRWYQLRAEEALR